MKEVTLFCNWKLVGLVTITPVVPKLLIMYHLWDLRCDHMPACSRKTQSTKYHSIKPLENQNWLIPHINHMTVRNYHGHFQKPTREVGYTKIQEFINRTWQVKTVAVNIFFVKKNEVGQFMYHLEGLRIPQFENHCIMPMICASASQAFSCWICHFLVLCSTWISALVVTLC